MKVYDVFISYARVDALYASHIRKELETYGLKVFLDTSELPSTAENFHKEIQSAIKSSHCMMVIMSPESKQSKYVNIEIAIAQSSGKVIRGIWIRGTENESFPSAIYNGNHADMRGLNINDRFDQMLKKFVQETFHKLHQAKGNENRVYKLIPPIDMLILESFLHPFSKIIKSGRVSLFWRDLNSEEMYLIASTRRFSYNELHFRFAEGIGIVGKCWQDETPIITNLSYAVNFMQGLSSEIREASRTIGTIWSSPIWHDESIIGVLTLDSKLSTSDLNLDDENSDESIEVNNLGFEFAEALTMLAYSFPQNVIPYSRYLSIRNVLRVATQVPR